MVNFYLLRVLGIAATFLTSCGGSGPQQAAANGGAPANAMGQIVAAGTDQFDAITTLVRQPRCPSAAHALQKISSIQGSARHTPPFGDQVTLRGIVTGDFEDSRQLHGFFMQQPATARKTVGADAIFVVLPVKFAHVASGHYVQVSGTVEELKDKAGDGVRLARINAVSSVDDCGASQPIAPRALSFPLDDLRQRDALEGVLVRITSPMTVTDNHDLGMHGMLLLSAGGRLWQPYNHPELSDPVAVQAQNQRAQILLDDGVNVVNPAPLPYLTASDSSGTRRSGDTITQLQGNLTRLSGEWRLQPTLQPQFTATNPRPATPVVHGDLRIGSMNVLSYFTTLDARGAKTADELIRQRDKLVAAIVALDADALGLMEIENNTEALSDLVEALNSKLGATSYAAVESGVQGTDAIKVALLYKPARLTPFGAAQLPTTAYRTTAGPSEQPRPPLAQLFSDRRSGTKLWLVVNHLKSKSRCGGPDSFDHDRGQGCWNLTRTSQARGLAKWVAGLMAESDEPKVLLIGDFNAYLAEDPVRALESTGYENLIKRLPASDRYSYIFGGQAGVLDHGFASAALQAEVTDVAIWHNDADEPATLDYASRGKRDDRYAVSPWRASDHDPLLIGLTLRTRDVRQP